MEPRFQEQQEKLRFQLANEGIPRGSERFEKEMQRLAQQQDDARLQAAARATELGGAEQQRLFGMGSVARDQLFGEQESLYGLGERARSRDISEYEAQRYSPFRESSLAFGGQRGVMTPQYSGISQIQAPFVDPSATAFGYQKLAQDRALAEQAEATRRYLGEIAPRPFTNQMGLEALRHQNQSDLLAQKFGYEQAGAGADGFDLGDAAGNIGMGFAGAAATAAAPQVVDWVGDYVGSWF
jgi:hypothetical protein